MDRDGSFNGGVWTLAVLPLLCPLYQSKKPDLSARKLVFLSIFKRVSETPQ